MKLAHVHLVRVRVRVRVTVTVTVRLALTTCRPERVCSLVTYSCSTRELTEIMCCPFQYLMSLSACNVETMSSVWPGLGLASGLGPGLGLGLGLGQGQG